MFVVLTLESDSVFVEIPSANKFKLVTIVSIDESDVYVLGDFVERSFVDGRSVGLIGMGNQVHKHYIPINIRRHTLGIKLVSHSFTPYRPKKNTKLILHFRK